MITSSSAGSRCSKSTDLAKFFRYRCRLSSAIIVTPPPPSRWDLAIRAPVRTHTRGRALPSGGPIPDTAPPGCAWAARGAARWASARGNQPSEGKLGSGQTAPPMPSRVWLDSTPARRRRSTPVGGCPSAAGPRHAGKPRGEGAGPGAQAACWVLRVRAGVSRVLSRTHDPVVRLAVSAVGLLLVREREVADSVLAPEERGEAVGDQRSGVDLERQE